MVTLSFYMSHVDKTLVIMVPSSILPTQCTLHFCRGKPASWLLFLHSVWLPSSMLPMQLSGNFRRGICVLFALSNRGISCYAIFAAYQRDLQVNIKYYYYYYYYYFFSCKFKFYTIVDWWSFTGVWGTTRLFRSQGLFSVF